MQLVSERSRVPGTALQCGNHARYVLRLPESACLSFRATVPDNATEAAPPPAATAGGREVDPGEGHYAFFFFFAARLVRPEAGVSARIFMNRFNMSLSFLLPDFLIRL